MKKIIIFMFVMISLFACKEEQQATRAAETQSQEEFLAKNKLNIPKKEKLKELTPTQKKNGARLVGIQHGTRKCKTHQF